MRDIGKKSEKLQGLRENWVTDCAGFKPAPLMFRSLIVLDEVWGLTNTVQSLLHSRMVQALAAPLRSQIFQEPNLATSLCTSFSIHATPLYYLSYTPRYQGQSEVLVSGGNFAIDEPKVNTNMGGAQR